MTGPAMVGRQDRLSKRSVVINSEPIECRVEIAERRQRSSCSDGGEEKKKKTKRVDEAGSVTAPDPEGGQNQPEPKAGRKPAEPEPAVEHT